MQGNLPMNYYRPLRIKGNKQHPEFSQNPVFWLMDIKEVLIPAFVPLFFRLSHNVLIFNTHLSMERKQAEINKVVRIPESKHLFYC